MFTTAALRSLASLVALSLLSACVFQPIPPAGPPRDPDTAEEARTFPESLRLLDAAQASLDAGKPDEALASTERARATIDAEGTKDKIVGRAALDALSGIEARRWLFQGLALRALGREFDALVALNGSTANACAAEIREKCQEHADWLVKTFPGVVGEDLQIHSIWRMHPPLTGGEIGPADRDVRAKKGWVAIDIIPTSKKTVKDGVKLRIDGETLNGVDDACAKVGTIRIDGQNHNVEQCHKEAWSDGRSDFEVTVSSEDAAKLSGNEKEHVVLLFDAKTWKKSGHLYSCGPARVASTWH